MKDILISFFLFAVVGIGTLLCRSFGWYNEYWFADIVLHTLSGLGFGFAWLWLCRGRVPALIAGIGAIGFACLGSVIWEWWEFFGWHITPSHARFYIPELGDTLGDIACGVLGGIISSFSYRKK